MLKKHADNDELIHKRKLRLISKISQVVETAVIVGNHDLISNVEYLSSNHSLKGVESMENVTLAEKPTVVNIKGDEFLLMPYVPTGRFDEALSEMLIN